MSTITTTILRPSTGRAELLTWINTLCIANYSTVSHLNDALLYCTVIELLVSHAPNNKNNNNHQQGFLEKFPFFDCNADDYGDDLLLSSGTGPSVNARQLTDRRLHNCRYLEHLLRTVVPSKWALQPASVDRLAQGKLQDHMIVLAHLNKWFCSHVNNFRNNNSNATSDGPMLRFVEGLDPATRRMMIVENRRRSTTTNNSNDGISPSLMIPRNAPVRDAHFRFLNSLGISSHEEENQQYHHDHQQEEAEEQEYHHRGEEEDNFNQNQNNNFRQIHVELDDAAVQLEVRREQLERDAASLKQLVIERDRMKLKLRKAYENLMLMESHNGRDSDGAAGFKMDIEKLFQEASSGKGLCTAEQILFRAMQTVPQQ